MTDNSDVESICHDGISKYIVADGQIIFQVVSACVIRGISGYWCFVVMIVLGHKCGCVSERLLPFIRLTWRCYAKQSPSWRLGKGRRTAARLKCTSTFRWTLCTLWSVSTIIFSWTCFASRAKPRWLSIARAHFATGAPSRSRNETRDRRPSSNRAGQWKLAPSTHEQVQIWVV